MDIQSYYFMPIIGHRLFVNFTSLFDNDLIPSKAVCKALTSAIVFEYLKSDLIIFIFCNSV